MASDNSRMAFEGVASVHGDPNSIMPAQFHQPRTHSGEVELCMALVEDAMWQIRLHVQHGAWWRAAEELRWFEGTEARGVSFEQICDTLNLDQAKILKLIHRRFGTSEKAMASHQKSKIEKMREANFRRNTTRRARAAARGELELKFA